MTSLLKKSKRDIINLITGIIYFTFCCFLSKIASSPWKPYGTCKTEPKFSTFNAIFAGAVLGLWLFCKVLWQCIILHRARNWVMIGTEAEFVSRYTKWYALIDGFFEFIAGPIWFFTSNIYCFISLEGDCFRGWMILDFTNYVILIFYTFRPACLFIFLVLCFPCACY